MHTSAVGETGSGKSRAQIERIMENYESAIVLDWKARGLSWEVAKHAAARGKRFVFDSLGWMKHGIQWRLVRRPKTRPFTKKEAESIARALSHLFMRYQGRLTLANTPLIETGAMTAIMCFLYQSDPFELRMLYRIFNPDDSLYEQAVANCTDGETQKSIERWGKLSPSARRYELGGAARMFQIVLTSPAFACRCEGQFDAAKFLNHEEGGYILIDGGDVSDEARRVMLGAISYHVLALAHRQKFKTRVGLWLDEAHEFAGHHECIGLRELRSSGLDITLVWQSIPPDMKEDVLQNCGRIEVYRCNSPESARLFAGMVAACMPEHPDVVEVQNRILNLNPPGSRFVRQRKAWQEYVPLLSEPYPWPGLTETRTWQAIKASMGTFGNALSLPGSKETPAPPPKSAKPCKRTTRNSPSPAIKLLRGFLGDSNENEESA
jgi:hypothetical protein